MGGKDECREQAGCVLGLGPGLGSESGSCFREGCVLGPGVCACMCDYSDQMWSKRAKGSPVQWF